MIALHLPEVKDCMHKLLLSETFDNFSFIEGSITTFGTFTFDGFLQKDYYNSDEQEALVSNARVYATWKEMRDYCFQLIKGNHTPLQFKFVFSLSNINIRKLVERDLPQIPPSEIQGLYLNFSYEKGVLNCITGTSRNTFSMDKSLDHLWDATTKKYLKQKEILFEECK